MLRRRSNELDNPTTDKKLNRDGKPATDSKPATDDKPATDG
jgi:hypothetical protein